eukprot:gene3249-2395_t
MDIESSTSAASASAVFRTQQSVLFSALIEKKLGLSLTWSKWRQKDLEIRSDATLWVRDPGATGEDSNTSESGATLSNLTSAITQTIASPLQTFAPGLSPIESYSVSKVRLTQMNHNAMDGNGTDRDFGILLECDTTDGFETKVRFILNELQFHDFVQALHMVSRDHNLDAVRQLSITEQVHATSSQKHVSRRVGAVAKNASTMRITIAMAMDQVNTLSRVEQVVEKRGVFKWLPVYFSNDLVHGAWWFVIASVLFTVSSAIVLDNSYKNYYLGEDDSFLDTFRYRASWVLMTISGAFFVLGSFAFVRATHEDPPMKPMFTWYHVQSDELLGSWLFFWGTVPIIPYILLYLAQSHGRFMYWIALLIACVFVFATLLFVRACYPNESENTRKFQIIQPITRALCCCFCSRAFLDKHLPNDWLAGNWIFFWGLFVGSVLSFMLLLYALSIGDGLLIFIMASSWVEMVGYTIGSAYWTAGSYPEDASGDAAAAAAGSSHRANLTAAYSTGSGNGSGTGNSHSNASVSQGSLLSWIFRGSATATGSSPASTGSTTNSLSAPLL